jgi:hypothetical protein
MHTTQTSHNRCVIFDTVQRTSTVLRCCPVVALQEQQHACMHRLVATYSQRVLCCLLMACVGSCAAVLIGMWLLHKALTAHGLAGRGCSTSPLLLQVGACSVLIVERVVRLAVLQRWSVGCGCCTRCCC